MTARTGTGLSRRAAGEPETRLVRTSGSAVERCVLCAGRTAHCGEIALLVEHGPRRLGRDGEVWAAWWEPKGVARTWLQASSCVECLALRTAHFGWMSSTGDGVALRDWDKRQ